MCFMITVAKEQGLRSRAAFKLSQINKQYPILDQAKVVLDLCAAPGGWTQIASRVCGRTTQIVAVDILPIRNLGNRNITTIVGDITTDKCKAEIQRAVVEGADSLNRRHAKKDGLVDVVLHDGAPNVGASYEKDAYEQMELSVHALRCATQHLKPNGAFVTKIYRSRDSASFQWVVQQLFKEVSVFKPKASRPQSAEIFYICQGYYRPDKIDPRLLDPKHIFEFVQGDTTGGGAASGDGNKNFHVFHKNWDKAKRQRGGYDTEHLDATMRHIQPLCDFVLAEGTMPAIRLLSSCTGFSFHCEKCQGENKETAAKSTDCNCQFFLHHPFTTQEIKECVVDLKVLNKGDFKGLMLWREKMLQALEIQKGDMRGVDENDEGSEAADEDESDEDSMDTDEEEEVVQQEIQALREKRLKEKKKLKKKERKLAAKKRRQIALGMDLNAIEVQEDDQFFSLDTLKSSKDLQKVAEVNLDQATDEQVFGAESDDEDSDDDRRLKVPEKDEDTGYSYRMERDLDSAYDRYLATTKDGAAKSGTKAAKRSKKLMREKLAQESHEDQELLLSNKQGMNEDTKKYAEMLQGPKDSEDEEDSSEEEDSDDDDDGFYSKPMTPSEHHLKKRKISDEEKKESNPLIHKFEDEPKSAKTARWFSNPLFSSIGEAAESAQGSHEQYRDESSKTEDSQRKSTLPDKSSTKGRKQASKPKEGDSDAAMTADDILAMIPKTDKQKRHEKRIKAMERDERRQARKAKRLGASENAFDLAPAADDELDDEDEITRMEGISEEKKRKLLDARRLIKAGMGSNLPQNDNNNGSSFEVVEAERPLPIADPRRYDSENEEYDSDDYAKTMALGTMMLRKSKAKALVDASYNRFAWNDPEDLPDWFVDDENRNYRPQLPIPQALIDKMKDKVAALSTRPIAKVAEARARKNRKAKLKLTAAKKKAQAIAGSSEISESMKLKQISKALRSDDSKKGSKEYVVSKKGKKGVKGAVMVDKRMKNDKRSMDRATKKRKSGKKGGLTGSKRRRHHS